MGDSKIILDIREILLALDISMEKLIESQVLDNSINPEPTTLSTSGPSPLFNQPLTPSRATRYKRSKQDSSLLL
jgi:hypothetical protein